MRVHKTIDAKLNKWASEKQAYLEGIDTRKVTSVQDALVQLGMIEAYKQEKADQTIGDLKRLQQVGVDITSTQHSTQYSKWAFETPATIADMLADLQV